MEIWKEIKGAVRYEVSNEGGIRSKAGKGTPRKKIVDGYLYMRTSLSNTGKPMVAIKKDCGKGTSINIARAIYQAFVDENIDYKTCVHHIDGDFNNCKLLNLSTDKIYLRRSKNPKHSERKLKEWTDDDVLILKKLWKNKHLTESSIRDYLECEAFDIKNISKELKLKDKEVHIYIKNTERYESNH